jgi:hypothetical protein
MAYYLFSNSLDQLVTITRNDQTRSKNMPRNPRMIENLADTILMIKESQIRYYSGKYMEEMWSRYDA